MQETLLSENQMAEQVVNVSSVLFDAVKTQAKLTNEVLASFSGGKDSLVVLDLCMKYFDKVQPFFMYLVPGLEFQESMLRRYERKYDVKILRVPHFELSSLLKYGSFTLPDHDISAVKVNDIYTYLRENTGIEWIAAGERIKDSIVRRAMIKKSGSIDYARGRFYPIAYWSKQDVLHYIKFKKLYLSPEQKRLGFSFKSLDGAELKIIKDEYPDDYKKILKMFPFAEAAVKRLEEYGK